MSGSAFLNLFVPSRSMVRKWQTLIEANIDVKTTDGYILRVFCIGFTLKDPFSQRKTSYVQHAQVKSMRRKMCEIISQNVTSCDLKGVVNKLLPDSIAKDIEKGTQKIFPLRDVYIRKVRFFFYSSQSQYAWVVFMLFSLSTYHSMPCFY